MNKKRHATPLCRFVILILACMILALAPAPLRADTPLTTDPALVTGVLANGMHYYIFENHKPEKRVEIRLVIKAGSLLENDQQQGIAHFIEHMGFNGTDHFKPGELVDYFESIGAEFGPDTNAYTSFDHTTYMLTLPTEPAEPFEKGLQAMRDYAGGMLFLPDEIEKEKGVVLEELRLGRDMQTRIFEKALAITMKGTIYPNRMPIGKKETIEAFTPELTRDYYTKWYRTDRMAIVVAGDIDATAVEKQIKSIYGDLKAPADNDALPLFRDNPHDEIYSGIVTDPELPISMVTILFIRDPMPYTSEEIYRTGTIEDIATGIYNSRLNEISLKDNPPFKSAGGGRWWNMLAVDLVAMQAQPDMKKEKKALLSLLEETERIHQHGVLQEEIDEQIRNIDESLRVAAAEKDKRESSNIASTLADTFLFGESFMDPAAEQQLFEKIKGGITLNDVQASVQKMFAQKNMTVLFILPEFQKSMYKEKDLLETVALAGKEDITPYTREAAAKSTDYTKLTPGDTISRETDEALGTTTVKFGNGLRIILKSTDFQKDEIIFSGFNLGGVLRETYQDRGLSKLASMAWTLGGTQDLTSVQIDRIMSGKTIGISPSGRENYSLSGNTVNKDFEETLQWLRDYLVIPGFREEGVAKARSLLSDSIKEMEADQSGVFNVELQELLCPGNPMAYMPTGDQVEKLTADQLRAFHLANSSPAGMEFTFVGNLDVENTVGLLARYLGSIPAANSAPIPLPSLECHIPDGLTRRVFYKGVEPRTQIAIVLPGPALDAPDVPAVKVLAKVAETRMLKRLREELSGTYYAYLSARFNPFIKGRNFLFAGMATDPKRVDEMIEETDKIFQALAADGPTEEELKTAKEVESKNLEENLKQNNYWLGTLSGSLTSGLPLDTDMRISREIQNVTADQVRAAAGAYLLTKTRIELIAMPENAAAQE